MKCQWLVLLTPGEISQYQHHYFIESRTLIKKWGWPKFDDIEYSKVWDWYQKINLNGNLKTKNTNTNVGYENIQSNGFTKNTAFERKILSIKEE